MQTDTWKAALRASCASTSVRFSLEEGGAPVPQDKDLRLNHATASDLLKVTGSLDLKGRYRNFFYSFIGLVGHNIY